MSNYKSELQSNNTDLQSIVNQIDELGTIVSDQDGIIAQIQSALQGSGETTVDDIGVFTVDEIGDIQHLFIKGMTWREWINSNMNSEFYCDGFLLSFWENDQIFIRHDDNEWYLGPIRTFSGIGVSDDIIVVHPDDIIEEEPYVCW